MGSLALEGDAHQITRRERVGRDGAARVAEPPEAGGIGEVVIGDEVEALALRALEQGTARAAYNLGIGCGFSVREVIAAAARISGVEVPVSACAPRSGDPATLVSDATRARKELGWRPEITDLGDIIGTAWAWHQRRLP